MIDSILANAAATSSSLVVNPGRADPGRGLFPISVAAELAGLNLAGIRRVLALQQETRQLQAELARLRELAGEQPAARRPRHPRPRTGSGSGAQPGSPWCSPDRPRGFSCPARPAPGPGVQAGGPGALGGQVVFQVQDPQRGGQGVALAGQLPDPGGEGELAAGVPAAAARGPLRPHRRRHPASAGTPAHPEDSGGPPGGAGRVIRVIQRIEPSGHRRGTSDPDELPRALDSFLQPVLYEAYRSLTW